jgi:Secretion system C-terminal sorting domain
MNNYTKSYFFKISILITVALLSIENGKTQELYLGSSAEFYLKANTNFTTSNTVVTKDIMGKFSVEAGNTWGSVSEYVDGEVTAIGSGDTKIPVGNNGVYAPVIATHSTDVIASYINSSPTSGTNGVDVDAVANVEYWELTGNAIVTLPWNNNSDITNLVNNNGGVLSSVAIVGYNSGIWNLVSATQTNTVTGDLLNGDVTSDINNEVVLNNFSQFTFGIDRQAVLSTDDLFLLTGINLLSNPVSENENTIRFKASNDLIDLKVTLYDYMGRKIRYYDNIKTTNGIGYLQKPNLQSGIYLLRFEFEGKQGVKKIILE